MGVPPPVSAIVIEHRKGIYEIWCDQHSTEADANTGFAPQAVLTDSAIYAQKRVDSHNQKWHAESIDTSPDSLLASGLIVADTKEEDWQ